jgi:hypothetical protein
VCDEDVTCCCDTQTVSPDITQGAGVRGVTRQQQLQLSSFCFQKVKLKPYLILLVIALVQALSLLFELK